MITKFLNTALLALTVSLLPQTAFSAQKVAVGAQCKSLSTEKADLCQKNWFQSLR